MTKSPKTERELAQELREVRQRLAEMASTAEALRESEEKFASIFRHCPVGLSLVRMKDHVTIEANDSYAGLTGYPREEIIGRKATDFEFWVNPADQERLGKALRETGLVTNDEISFHTKSGEIGYVRVSIAVVRIQGEEYLLNMVKDISRSKESELLFNALLSNAQLGTYLLQDHKFQIVNPQIQEYSGRSEAELLSMNALDLVYPDDREELQRNVVQMLKGQRSEPYEFRIVHKSGELKTIMEVATSVTYRGRRAVLASGIEISERIKAVEALRKKDERLLAFGNALPDLAFILDKNGCYVEIINGESTLLYKEASSIVGQTLHDVLPQEIADLGMKTLRKAIKTGQTQSMEYQLNVSVGPRLFEARLSPMALSNRPSFDAVAVIVRDITVQRQMENKLRESEEFSTGLLENSPNPIVMVNPDISIRYVNPAFEKLTGFSMSEVSGIKVPYPWWPEETREKRLANIRQSIGNSSRKFKSEEIIQNKRGERSWIELHSSSIEQDGQVKYHISNWADITERKQMEEALRESEEKFSGIFHHSPVAFSFTRMKDDVIIEINESFTRSTGYTRAEVIGHKITGLNHWADPADRQRMLQILAEQGRVTDAEYDFRKKSGEIQTVSLSVEKISFRGEDCLLVMTIDITERKRIEKKLRESEEFSTSLLENAPNPIEVVNPDTSTKYVNKAFEELTGFTSDEIVGRRIPYPWWPEESKAELSESIKKDIAQGYAGISIYRKERAFRKKNGERFWAEFSIAPIKYDGKLAYLLVNWVDITERKRAEELLQKTVTELESFINNIPDMAWLKDADSNFIMANRAFGEAVGMDPEYLISNSCDVCFGAEVAAKFKEDDRKVMTSRKQTVFEESITDAKRNKVWLETIKSPIQDTSGNIIGTVGIARNITERKKAEKKLKQALTDLEQSGARLAAANKELEAFSYSVSHDLRSPLRSIDGFSQALLEDYTDKLDATGQDYLRRLRSASQKMGELIDGMLKLSRLSRSEMHREKVDLSALAGEIANRLREQNPERKAEFTIGSGLTVYGDPQLLRVLLENLLGNAWKFTGKVPLARIEFGLKQNGSQATFFVKDNGAGFDMNYVGKLFGAFQRLHDATEFPGNGIGLATVQRIINRHGGAVRAEGEIGKGATFYFTLD